MRGGGGGGGGGDATTVRLCDRHGCEEPGDCPAPKAPNNPARWYFCQRHAAEYNRQWDYFEGLDKEEAAERERVEQQSNAGYAEAAHYGWAGSGDGSRGPDEMRALELLGGEVDGEGRGGDREAAQRFQAYSLAYEVLRQAAERREWQG